MNASVQQLERSHSEISIVFDIVAKAPHVFVHETESEFNRKSGSKKNFVQLVIGFALKLVSWLTWLAQASIVRSVAPGARSLQRHEFESLESRRGGFGNVF